MNQQTAIETLTRFIRARYPVIVLLSHEESRVLSAVQAIAAGRKAQMVTWSITEGLRQPEIDYTELERVQAEGRQPEQEPDFDHHATCDPIPAFSAMLAAAGKKKYLFVLKDLHGMLGNRDRGFDPVLTRLLRDAAAALEKSPSTMILLSPAFAIPPELEKSLTMLDWPLPDAGELESILRQAERELPADYPNTLNGERGRVVEALRGLTQFEARQVLAAGIIATHGMGEAIIPWIVKEKAQIIKKAGTLEYFEAGVTMQDVGGLQYLKRHAARDVASFSAAAADAGVDRPKGLLLAGIPGTGKSLAAKAIAGGRLPLLRLDMGAIMGGLVGQSEGNMRSALKVAEAVAPAVLWVDEIEKGLGGSGGELDGGTSQRVFGTLLTWMQEKTAPVYVIATCNNFARLQPELVRRFDAVFWVDLPNAASRAEILGIHLARRNQDAATIDLPAVVDATWGYSGGEIENVVREAVKAAFFDQCFLTTEMLLDAASQVVPLYASMGDQLKNMRSQIKSARAAGDPLEAKPVRVVDRGSFDDE